MPSRPAAAAVTYLPAETGFALHRAGTPMHTPRRHAIVVPEEKLAHALCAEWKGKERYDVRAMPLTALSFTALDVVAPAHAKIVDTLMVYAETDLVLYRSETPPLKSLQEEGWNPVVHWARGRYDMQLLTTEGVMPIDQPPRTMEALRKAVAACDAFTLAGVSTLAQNLSSLLLALAVKEGFTDARHAFTLSRIDEDYQTTQWGEDSLTLARAREIERDVRAAGEFLETLGA